MTRRRSGCDPNRLRLLLQEGLPDKQQAEVVDHLDICEACQGALEGLAADKPWWDGLRQLHHQGGLPEANSIAVGTEQRFAASADRGPPESRVGADFPLDFLAPAEDPAHLGRLGAFAVTAVLGRGGMGVVLKAWDAALNRPVAIKVLVPHYASNGAARKRFAREAQAAAAVVHEHVVPIHGVDSWKGIPYLVMAYVAGHSLQERIDRDGPLGVKEVLRIGMQAASGLAAAHAQGLVHRDVKPANILLENGVERVRLTDFGLARAVDDASVTQSGVVAGTPPYMAPEQACGGPVDHRADLFSLGSTLYAMCTGHAPFRADSAMAVLRRVCDEQPRPIREINSDIPEWLVAVIATLHAKEPCDRFQTAAEVAELLGGCLAHLQQPNSILLPTIVTAASARRKGERRAGRWVMAAAVLLAMSLGAWAMLHWTPLDGSTPSRQDPVTSSDSSRSAEAAPAVMTREEDPLQPQVADMRRRIAALEADLRQSPVAGLGDPAEVLLRQARQRLHDLEHELGATVPEQ
jgi:serine/threonine protein kinase